MRAGCTPADSAISRRRAPAKPRAANSRSPASRMRSRVAAAFRSRLGPAGGSVGGGMVRRPGRGVWGVSPHCDCSAGAEASGAGVTRSPFVVPAAALGRSIPGLELYHVQLLEPPPNAWREEAEPLDV